MKKYLIDLGILTLTLIVWLIYLSFPDTKLRIIACDVGQGDAILIIKGSFETVIDGGPDDKVLECLGKYMPFWDHTIELAILTHPQADHYTGFLEVFKRYKVDTFLANAVDNDTQGYRALKKLVGDDDIKVIFPKLGQRLSFGPVSFDILNPIYGMNEGDNLKLGAFSTTQDLNDFSILAKLSYGNFKALFTGDIGPKQTALVLGVVNIGEVDYLKVPHHGSSNGLSEELLTDIKPKIAAISVGRKNRYGHPDKETLDLLEKFNVLTLRTDQVGDIIVWSDGTNYGVLR